jgi:Flp pilus assembly pilin Flp
MRELAEEECLALGARQRSRVGQAMIEYALLMAVVAVLAIGSVRLMSDTILEALARMAVIIENLH